MNGQLRPNISPSGLPTRRWIKRLLAMSSQDKKIHQEQARKPRMSPRNVFPGYEIIIHRSKEEV